MKKNLFLIVDDDLDIRVSIAAALEIEGYSSLEAENGFQAIELLKKLKAADYPCCIILDLMMPVMSGEEFLNQVEEKHSADLATIPIVIASAGSSINHVKSALVKDRLRKPLDLDELYSVAEKYCQASS